MRMLSYLAVGVSLAGLAGSATAQAPAVAKAPRPVGRVAVFNVAKVMRDYQRWQHYANVMNTKRTAASANLVKLRTDIAETQNKITTEVLPTKKDELGKKLVELQRQFEDAERVARKQLDDESAGYLKNLFAEIQQCVKAIVEAYNYDLVLAYPDAITPEEKQSPMYFDLMLRPPAAMPFFVSGESDMTEVLIATLNKSFPAPAGSPVTQTGGTVPTPGAPAGTAAPR